MVAQARIRVHPPAATSSGRNVMADRCLRGRPWYFPLLALGIHPTDANPRSTRSDGEPPRASGRVISRSYGIAPGDLAVTDLNEMRQIVGVSNGVGVIIKDGIAYDLNDMLPGNSPWHIARARGLNAKGQVAAVGAAAGGSWRALLLTTIS